MSAMARCTGVLNKLKFTTSKTVDILDWRLALSQYALQALFLAYFLSDLIINSGHLYKEVPLGRVASAYVTAGKLADLQEGSPDFCERDKSPSFTWDGCEDEPFWCDDNVRCTRPQFNQMYAKTDEAMWLFTYNKDAMYITLPSCAGQTGRSNTCPDGFSFERTGGQCRCLSISNYWMMGAEGLTLNIVPTYSTSTTIRPHMKNDYATAVYDSSGALVKEVPPGELLSFSMSELLGLIGVGLDEVNPRAEQFFKSRSGSRFKDDEQVYRMTGLEVELEFIFEGVVGGTMLPSSGANASEAVPDTVQLRVRARDRGVSYASFGSQITYLTYPAYNCTRSGPDAPCEVEGEVFVDRYMRGIKVSYSFTGKVSTFSIFSLVQSLTSFLVLFNLASTLVSVVAMSLMGHASKIYEGVRAEDVSVDRAHAKIGAQTVIAALSYDEMCRNGEEITEGRLAGVLSAHGVDADDAALVAQSIIAEATKGGGEEYDGKLSYVEWRELVTDDLAPVEKVVSALRKRAGRETAAANKRKGSRDVEATVAPEPPPGEGDSEAAG